MRSLLAGLGLFSLAVAAPAPSPNGKYIVVMKSGSTASVDSLLKEDVLQSAPVHHRYSFGNFRGLAATLSEQQVAALKSNSNVAYIERDGVAKIMDVPGSRNAQSRNDEAGAPWGLGRISHTSPGSTDYIYDSSAGAGACAYVIDTGVYADHPEFAGRAKLIKSFTGVNQDDNGHGTHVSGTIASKTYGVAKNALVFGIKVLDAQGSGEWSTIISGIQYAVQDSASRAGSCPNGFVVNMSLGGGFQQSINDAVAQAVQAGLFFGVAAGNDGTDDSSTSPASEPSAMTVGASDSNDGLAYFSNYGSNLGLIGPGVDVLSTWNNGQTQTDSGTSMATPHIVGLAAYLLGLNGPQSPAALKSTLQSLAQQGKVNLGAAASATPNYLAYNGEN